MLGLEGYRCAKAAGSVQRLLDVHAEVHHILQELNLADRLERSTHDTERQEWFAVPHRHCRDDRVQWALAANE